MGLPRNYTTETEQNIASYDFVDMITGKAYAVYYLANVYEGGLDYVLTPNELYSSTIEFDETIAVSTDPAVKVEEEDFDITFALPRIVEGECMLTVCFQVDKAGGNTCNAYFVGKIIHYDGTTETTLATLTSQTVSHTTSKILTAKGTISKTHFAPGDILRLTLEIWGYNNDGANAGSVTWGCDPQNRDGTKLLAAENEITKSLLYIPIKPDL